MSTNKHGLSRPAPSPVRRQVRQECGFGCVICGASIYEYAHLDPPFRDAKEHRPERMALLCPNHHTKLDKELISLETVESARSNPQSQRDGFASDFFDIGMKEHPTIEFAGSVAENCVVPLQYRDVPLCKIESAEEGGAPFRLSAQFFNSEGEPSLRIIENEWQASTDNWDVEATGARIVVRDAHRHISLRIVADPPDKLIIDRLDMRVGEFHLNGTDELLEIERSDGMTYSVRDALAKNNYVGYQLGLPSELSNRFS